MAKLTRVSLAAAVVLVALASLAAPAGAVDNASSVAVQDHAEEEDNTIINIDIGAIVSAIEDLLREVQTLRGSLTDIIVQAGLKLLVEPFQLLAQLLSDVFTHVIVSYPDVKHSDVLEVHHLVFQLTLLLAVPVFIWIGFQHMTGRADGIRPTVELVVVLVLGGLSPWLLHYPVQLSELASQALRPDGVSIVGSLSVSLTTAVIIWFQAIILLALVILFVVRSFYLLWYTAAAPLIFLLTYFEPTRKFASPLSGLFVGFLLMAPFDLIAYQLVLALLDMRGGAAVPQYIWGLGGYFVMLALPYQILSSSSSLVFPALVFSKDVAGKAGDRVKPAVRDRYQNIRDSGVQRIRHTKNRFLKENPQQVELHHRSTNEVELRDQTSRARRTANNLRNRMRTDQAQVSVEDSFREDETGDWQHENEFNTGGS